MAVFDVTYPNTRAADKDVERKYLDHLEQLMRRGDRRLVGARAERTDWIEPARTLTENGWQLDTK